MRNSTHSFIKLFKAVKAVLAFVQGWDYQVRQPYFRYTFYYVFTYISY